MIGRQSLIWQAFMHSQATLVGDVYSNGENGALTRIQPFVREEWQQSVPRPTG
jgi:hypothetical protein